LLKEIPLTISYFRKPLPGFQNLVLTNTN